MNIIGKILVGSLTAAAITGCATSSEPYSIPVTNLQPKTFTFKKFETDGYKAVSKEDTLRAVRQYIVDNSAYQNCKSSIYGSNCSKTGSSGIVDSWGANVFRNDNVFNLVYFKNSKYSTGRVEKASVDQSFPYTITEADDSISITLTPATQAKVKPGTDAIGIPFKVGISDENVTAWTHRLFTSSDLAKVDETVSVKGEFDIALEPDSVKSNLIRNFNLKFRDKNNGVQSTAMTTRRMGQHSITMYVTLNLYRGKTKLEYTIKQPFSLTSNAALQGYSDKIIATALNELKKAANS